jgi:hypothetical protein
MQVAIQYVLDVLVTLFAPEVVLLLHGAGGSIGEALRVVAHHDKLDGAEEALDIGFVLVVNALANGGGDIDACSLKFQHGERDAVDIENDVGPLVVDALDGHFLGEGEVVVLPVLPIDQIDGLIIIADSGLDLDAVAQLRIDIFVDIVDVAVLIARYSLEFVYCAVDEILGVGSLFVQEGAQQALFDVAVIGALAPVAQIVVV